MTRLERYLEPGETVSYGARGTSWVLAAAIGGLTLVAPGFVVELLAGDLSFVHVAWKYPLTWILLVFVLSVGIVTASEPALLVTDRRVIHKGALERRVLAIERNCIVEARGGNGSLILIGAAPGDVRCLSCVASLAPAGLQALGMMLKWQNFSSKETQMDRVVRELAVQPLSWRKPDLPPVIDRLRALNGWAIALSLPPWAWAAWHGIDSVLGEPSPQMLIDSWGAWGLLALFVASLWPIQRMRRYLVLALIARIATPEAARLYLCSRLRPDWRGEHRDTVIDLDGRDAKIAREETILSRFYGRPLRCDDGPGPEAFGGGWVP